MNPNDKIFSEQIRRRIALERYSDQQADDLLKFLREVRRDVVSKLAGAPASYTRRQQELLLDSIDRTHKEIYSRLTKQLEEEQKKLAADEAAWQAGTLRGASGITIRELSIDQAYTVAKARPMQGRFLEDWMTDLEPSHRERLNAALRISFIEGETQSAAYRRISEVLGRGGNGLRALIRTSNSHISSAVQHKTYEVNSDIIDRYEWRSTLDTRTTPICQSRDGNIYNTGDGPQPPAHVSCRSTTTGILKGQEPPKRKTYKEWLAEQPPDVQDEALGSKKRGDAYRRGEGSSGFRPPPPAKPKVIRPPPIPPPPKLPPTPTHALDRKQYAELLEKSKASAQPFARRILNKLGVGPMDGPNVQRSDAYYSGFRNLIYMKKDYATGNQNKARAVMLHEQGHAIDYAKTTRPGFPRSSAFVQDAADDLQELSDRANARALNPDLPLKKLTAAERQAAKDLVPGADELPMEALPLEQRNQIRAKIERALASGDPNDLVDVFNTLGRTPGIGGTQMGYDFWLMSDYLEAITKTRWGRGHGEAYYKARQSVGGGYSTGNMTEAFANAFAVLGGRDGKMWRAIFARFSPKFSKRVMDLIAEDLKG